MLKAVPGGDCTESIILVHSATRKEVDYEKNAWIAGYRRFVCRRRIRQGAGATLSGRILDSSGAVIPGAEVQLRNVATNQSRGHSPRGRRVRLSQPGARPVRTDRHAPGIPAPCGNGLDTGGRPGRSPGCQAGARQHLGDHRGHGRGALAQHGKRRQGRRGHLAGNRRDPAQRPRFQRPGFPGAGRLPARGGRQQRRPVHGQRHAQRQHQLRARRLQ